MWIRLAALIACHASSTQALRLDGPDRVTVDRLGPVSGPRIVAGDGELPSGLIWTLSREGVARLDGNQVIAEGPGEVAVIAEWEGAKVQWTLVVELETQLSFVSPPPRRHRRRARPAGRQRPRRGRAHRSGPRRVDLLGQERARGRSFRPRHRRLPRRRLRHGDGVGGVGDGRGRGPRVASGLQIAAYRSRPRDRGTGPWRGARGLRRRALRRGGPRGPWRPCAAWRGTLPCGR